MNVGQPKFSERNGQKSGLFGQPTEGGDPSTSKAEEFRLKEGITNRGWIVCHWSRVTNPTAIKL
jgi:hypothetical protein